MFFVVSTGRSGSQTLAHVLSQAPQILCLHEPHPQLVAESARFRAGSLGADAVAALLHRTRPRVLEGRRYGETNNRLALLLPPLLATFPDAQVVHLLRDGRDVVASEVQRGAFRPDQPRLPWRRSKWDRWRVGGDLVGDVRPRAWAAMTPFEKVCWQWGYINALVRDDSAGLGPEQARTLRLEDLGTSLDDLSAWLGIPPMTFHIPRSNARRAVAAPDAATRHPNAVTRVTGWSEWSTEQRDMFVHHCGAMMNRHYPGWRTPDGTWAPTARAEAQPRPDGAEADDADALLRYELARATIARLELRSELDVLTHSPRLLLRHLGVALRAPLRRS